MATASPSHRRRRLTSLLVAGLLLVLGTTHARASSWWNSDWTLRKKITLDTSATGVPIDGPLGTGPVLLRLTDGNFRFTSAQPDGSDLRFVAEDDKTLLPYHVEKFDTLLNEALVWVKVSDLKPSAKTTIWMYYGNSGKVAKAEDAKATYDDQIALVYHFAEQGQPAYDSSGNGNNGQNPGLPADGSLIGSGLRLDGKTTITIPTSPTLFWTEGAAFTWSAWIKFGPPQPHAVVFSRRNGSKFFLIGADNGVPFVESTYQGGTVRSNAAAPVAAGSWHHLALVAKGAHIALYLDGQPYATLAGPLPALDGPAVLGADGVGGLMNTTGGSFAGEMDELEISKVAREPGFLQMAVASQGRDDAAKFLTIGEDEQHTSWISAFKTGYVGVIIGSLSVDGWLVIGILAVMSLISWIVMIRKALYLNRVVKGNAQFLEDWSHVATDLSVLDASDAAHAKSMGGRADGEGRSAAVASPLYSIYHIGVEEIHHRLSADRQSGGTKVLSARSIQAIRAALDGGLVRETQRLSAQMVLLTIAISGGPFLGLLGTVVGVMITFAAVAAAGDVNVNAIAPGIAAALAATVAGLGVAIPALFGYNYLLTRIKSVSSDLHVFIDEFVAKLAEFYSDEAGPADSAPPQP